MTTERRSTTYIRPPAVAGTFYPRDATALREALSAAYASPLGPGATPAVSSPAREVFGIISPHAGYVYSAQGAAWSFAQLADTARPEAVVLLGVNHRAIGASIALSEADGWATPLGVSPIARQLGDRLRELDPAVVIDERAHRQEHSLEVQLPFIQALYGDIAILPISLASPALTSVSSLGTALGTLAKESRLLFVASTDFSHYIAQREAEERDQLALSEIARVNPEGLVAIVQRLGITMCGVLPVTTLLVAARHAGIVSATVLHYHTSGDVTGDHREVVGYGAAVIYR